MERRPSLSYTSLGWNEAQTEAFNNMKAIRPDLAKRVVRARDTIFSSMKHDPHEVAQAHKILDAWGMRPEVFEVKPK